ncbi:MAG: hypothetical protein RMJ89_08340 [Flammeovirgaceae bacterium]|nr:hypothetical protein [Flammeovirgaceae bacterium]
MKKYSLILLALVGCLPVFAQVYRGAVGAEAVGMGGAVVAMESPYASFNNIANVAQLKEISLVAAYENKFSIGIFNTVAAACNLPLKNSGVIALTTQRFGNEAYSEQSLSLGYAYHLGGVNLGLKANYLQYAAEGLGTRSTVGLDFGVRTQLAKTIFLAAHFFNVNQARLLAFQNERVPSVLKIGFSYTPTDKLMVNIEGEKDLAFEPLYRAGIAYKIVPQLTGRVGISTLPQTSYFGIGFHSKRLQLDYAIHTHPSLNLTHNIGLLLVFNAKHAN